MRLWIDGQCLQTASALRGIGRYMHELIGGLAQNCDDVDLSISFNAGLADEAIAAIDVVKRWIKIENIHVWQGLAEGGEALVGLTERRLLSELALSHHVEFLRPDVALSASPFEGAGDATVPLLPSVASTVPTAAIFYDAIPRRFPNHYLTSPLLAEFYDRRFKAHAGFGVLLGISEFAAQEARSFFPAIPCVSIDAGMSSQFLELVAKAALDHGPDAAPLAVAGPFLLYVGALDWRKNVGIVVDAYKHLPSHIVTKFKFVVAGAYTPDTGLALQARWRDAGLPPTSLVMLGRIPDEALAQLYRSTDAVIQPSIMEGFGLTALEALSCGVPVIGANTGALPEVIGDPSALFDPTDAPAVARLIEKVYSDPKFGASLVEQGARHIQKFTWKRSAELTVAAARGIMAKGQASPNAGDRTPTIAAGTGHLDREKFARLAAPRKVDMAEKVAIFAAAEAANIAAPRLIVDVSGMCARDHGTGIQRVARKILHAWAGGASTGEHAVAPSLPIDMVSCTKSGRYAPARCDGSADVGRFSFDETATFRPGCGGHILLLDGSWDFHEQHAVILRKARLKGNDVTTVLYDLIPLQMSAFCAPGVPAVFCNGFRAALQFSTGFVCISKAVADEFITVLETLRFPRQMKVGYWHLGADFMKSEPAGEPIATASEGAKPAPVFLMVGTLEPRKGHRIALQAFGDLWRAGHDATLVIVGKMGWGADQLATEIRSNPEFGRRLVWIETATDAELRRHYRSCDAVIAASYTEGFGLPIVEAAYFDKPVIASDIPVFREVGGDMPGNMWFECGSALSLATTVQAFLSRAPAPEAHLGALAPRPWKSWAESAADLEQVVVGGQWYRTYRPPEQHGYKSLALLGETRMSSPIEPQDRRFKLDLVEGPVRSGDGQTIRFVVALTNLSATAWSSAGPENAALGIVMSYHILDANGAVLQYDNPREPIPFVLPPGGRQYMALTVPGDWVSRGGASLDIELVQEMVAWWGATLRVPLQRPTPA